MKNHTRRFFRMLSAGAALSCALYLISCSSPPKTEESVKVTPTESPQKLRTYQQSLNSTIKHLDLKPGQRVTVPVVVTNSGSDPWVNTGANVIDLSYHWLRGDEMLPIVEGARTPLPRTLNPGESVTLNATVVAPSITGELILGFSMVQEGVTWFAVAPSGNWYRITASIK